jgi:large subunit ribosomal protein L21
MKSAVIKTGGKQYLVEENAQIKIEKLQAETGDKIEFETYLIADGDKVEVGTPSLDRKVTGTVTGQSRTKKVTGIKYKPKTRESTKYGHRQTLTEVTIDKI